MPAAPFEAFASSCVVLPIDDIDTDQIVPARFLTTTERTGLGAAAFADWRYRPDGSPIPDFPLNDPESAGARVLVAGRNFGCGSSREHAVWALLGAGFRAVVSASFADIFRGNALGNGLLPIELPAAAVARLADAVARDRRATVGVDLASQTLVLPDGEAVPFPIAPFARHRLLHGIDELDFLLEAAAETGDYESAHPASVSTLAPVAEGPCR